MLASNEEARSSFISRQPGPPMYTVYNKRGPHGRSTVAARTFTPFPQEMGLRTHEHGSASWNQDGTAASLFRNYWKIEWPGVLQSESDRWGEKNLLKEEDVHLV